MKKLLLGILVLGSISSFANDKIECALKEYSIKPVIEVSENGDEKNVNLLTLDVSFSDTPTVSLVVNELGQHVGYQEQIVYRVDGQVEQLLAINYDLDSEPTGGTYSVINQFSTELVCERQSSKEK